MIYRVLLSINFLRPEMKSKREEKGIERVQASSLEVGKSLLSKVPELTELGLYALAGASRA